MDLFNLKRKGGRKKGSAAPPETPVTGRKETAVEVEDPHNTAGPSRATSMGPPQLAGAPTRVPKRRKAVEAAAPTPGTSAPPPETPLVSRKKRKEAPPSPQDGEDDEGEFLPRGEILRELDRWSPEHLSSAAICGSALRTLEALSSFRVFPSYSGDQGVPLARVCQETRRGVEDLREALCTLRKIAQGEGADARVAYLEDQVRDMKAEMGRLQERLTNLSRAGAPKASQPRAGGSTTVAPPEREPSKKGPAAKKPAARRKPERLERPVRTAQPGGSRGTAPPPHTSSVEFPPLQPNEEGWREVRRRRKPTAAREEGGRQGPIPETTPGPRALGGGPKKRAKRRAAPRKAAVTITTTGERTYASLMKEAREKISLAEYGLEHLALKRARNGGLLFEIPGPDGHDKADNLARALEEVLCGGAVIARPVKRAELRVSGLDDSTSPHEVVRAMREVAKRPEADFQVGEIRRSATGLGALWVRCPLESAIKLADSKHLKVGWTLVRVQLLEDRPLQCYRCLAFGHMAASCGAQRDLKGRCFRCGGAGHVAQGCTAELRCPLCEAEGGNPSHRMGGKACPAAARAQGRPPPSSGRKPRRKGKRGGRTGGVTGGRRAAPAPPNRGSQGAPLPEPPTHGRQGAPSQEPPDVDMPSTSTAGAPPPRGGVLPPREDMADAEGSVLGDTQYTQYDRIPSLEAEFDWEAPENTPLEPSQSN